MKTLLPLFLLFLALASRAAAQDADPFSQANRAFAENRYDDAIRGYEALLAQPGSGPSAPVLFDLGNAYFRTGRTGQALARYERARLLSPRDPDLLANEALVRRKAGLPEAGSRWQEALRLLSPNEWAELLAGAVVLACAGFFAAALRPAWRRSLRPVNVLLVLAAVAAATAGGLPWTKGDWHRAWVIEADAPVRISPFTEAKAAYTLPDGAAVTVKGAHDAFLLIEDAKGASGWIDRSQLAPLLPPR